MEYTNFYESLKEAHIRLRGCVVLYDSEPYLVLSITNHKPDGIFRVYLEPLPTDPKTMKSVYNQSVGNYPYDAPNLPEALDKWADDPKTGILRKQMNSPLFGKFRPFPLGMYISEKETYYLERTPLRSSPQGLKSDMIDSTHITASPNKGPSSRGFGGTFNAGMRDCILGNYPTAKESLEALLSDEYDNNSLAFHREFAFVRGPIDMIFLAYKSDVVGALPKSDFSKVKLGRKFGWAKEVVQELSLFDSITGG